jgi:hypothetical protein
MKMKVLFLTLFLFSTGALAGTNPLGLNNTINLMTNKNEVFFQMGYPGHKNGFCGVKIISTSRDDSGYPMADLMNKIEVLEGNQLVQPRHTYNYPQYSLKFNFSVTGGYVGFYSVKTKSGEPLRKVVTESLSLNSEDFVGLIAVPCSFQQEIEL